MINYYFCQSLKKMRNIYLLSTCSLLSYKWNYFNETTYPTGKFWSSLCPKGFPRTPPSNLPWTSLKDPIWASWKRFDLTSRRRPYLTCRGRPNLTFNWCHWEFDLGRSQDVLRTSRRGPSKHSNLDVPKFFLYFLSELVRLTKSTEKHFNT